MTYREAFAEINKAVGRVSRIEYPPPKPKRSRLAGMWAWVSQDWDSDIYPRFYGVPRNPLLDKLLADIVPDRVLEPHRLREGWHTNDLIAVLVAAGILKIEDVVAAIEGSELARMG